MSHYDFVCCACCDKKIRYVGFLHKMKTELCDKCLMLCKHYSIPVYDKDSLMKYINDTSVVGLKNMLVDILGYKKCSITNIVDSAFEIKLGVNV